MKKTECMGSSFSDTPADVTRCNCAVDEILSLQNAITQCRVVDDNPRYSQRLKGH